MKKVYMPTMDELYLMQDMTNSHSTYKYILVKAIESLIIDGINLPNKGILKNAYKYLRENPEIAYAICRLYPEEIKYSEYAKNDANLCQALIINQGNQDKSIFSLDNLCYFEESTSVFSQLGVISRTADILATQLQNTPQYRFEYKQNTLLDNIFSCEIPTDDIFKPMIDKLVAIEPAYVIKLDSKISEIVKFAHQVSDVKGDMLIRNINRYANRYGININAGYEYYAPLDILTNPDTEVKRLLKCINEHQKRH